MKYYVTKECGAGWDDATQVGSVHGWGVSRGQESLAKRVQPGDILLHFIDHARAWAGYSEVTGPLGDNTRDTQHDWLKALPLIVPLRECVYLTKLQCQLTREIADLCGKHYERRRSFSVVLDQDARLIIAAVTRAKGSGIESEDAGFRQAWETGADAYYGAIVKAVAGYKCMACGQDGISWAKEHLNGQLRDGDEDAGADWFLEAAHIKPRHEKGPATPDNLRALCRNCHHSIDRLPEERRIAYLMQLNSWSSGAPRVRG